MVPNIQTWIVLFSINYLFALKWFQILQSYINSFICTQLNGFKHHYLNINTSIQYYSFICSVKRFQVFQCIANNSIKHKLFVYIQLNINHFYLDRTLSAASIFQMRKLMPIHPQIMMLQQFFFKQRLGGP